MDRATPERFSVPTHTAILRAAVDNVLQLLRGKLPDSCRNREIENHRMEL